MKNVKRILALVLVMLVAFAATGCHKKGEIAFTIGDIEFTSAYYMCALMNADSQAKTIVSESLTEEEQSEEIDYYSHKVEDKDYVEWVEETAMETLKKIAAYKTFCKENELCESCFKTKEPTTEPVQKSILDLISINVAAITKNSLKMFKSRRFISAIYSIY